MKILIVSDTHKKNENYFKVLEMHHPDMVIHCGDAEGSEYALSSAAECPVYIVLGNNDFFSDLPREITLDIGSYKVWVTTDTIIMYPWEMRPSKKRPLTGALISCCTDIPIGR